MQIAKDFPIQAGLLQAQYSTRLTPPPSHARLQSASQPAQGRGRVRQEVPTYERKLPLKKKATPAAHCIYGSGAALFSSWNLCSRPLWAEQGKIKPNQPNPEGCDVSKNSYSSVGVSRYHAYRDMDDLSTAKFMSSGSSM